MHIPENLVPDANSISPQRLNALIKALNTIVIVMKFFTRVKIKNHDKKRGKGNPYRP